MVEVYEIKSISRYVFPFLSNLTVYFKNSLFQVGPIRTNFSMKIKFKRPSLLRHVIEDKSVPDPIRMRPLLEMSVLSDMNSLQRTLGPLSYSKWIPRFSEKLLPILCHGISVVNCCCQSFRGKNGKNI